jgi:DnaK suppressor protein
MRLACEARGAVARRFREEASRQEDIEEARRQGRARAAGGQTRAAPSRARQGQARRSEEEAGAGQEGRRPEGGAEGPGPQGAAAEKAAPAKGKATPVAKKAASAKAPAAKWPSPAPKPVAAKPWCAAAAHARCRPPAPTPTTAQAAGASVATGSDFVPRKPGRGTPKYFVAPVQAPLPPPTSRFADRFAPPRPPTRQMNKTEQDTPRQQHKADPKLANAWKTKAGRDLTDDELLAMPESEYMNDKQLEFFRMKLQALKDDLLSNAGETTEHLREDTSIVPDPADRATIEEEHALELRTRDRERKLLKKISQSLARIDSGEYGFCDETGEPIGLGRLIARPTATLSLEAQQRRELKQKMFGD